MRIRYRCKMSVSHWYYKKHYVNLVYLVLHGIKYPEALGTSGRGLGGAVIMTVHSCPLKGPMASVCLVRQERDMNR